MLSEPILSTRAIYLQIRDILALRIRKGLWAPRESIPSEAELALQFHVSIATIRKALALMEREDLIHRVQGRGTFVTDRISHAYRARYDRIRRPDGSRFDWLFLKTDVTRDKASALEAEALQIEQGADIYRLQRIRKGGAGVVAWESAVIPVAISVEIKAGEAPQGIVTWAHQNNVLLGQFSQFISVEGADEKFAEIANIARGDAVWRLRRTVYDSDGQAVEYRESVITPTGCIYVHEQS